MKAIWYEVGNCRGNDFCSEGSFDVDELIKEAKAITEEIEIEILMEKEGIPFNLFYNMGYEIKSDLSSYKEAILKVLKAIKRRKIVIGGWEEGTTGVSVKLKKKELVKEVEAADYRALKGISVGNVKEIIKK